MKATAHTVVFGSHELWSRLVGVAVARKNIGYLYAIEHGATVVFDTDDDNILMFRDGFDHDSSSRTGGECTRLSDIGTACWFLPSRCVVVVRVVTVTATTFEVDSDACCCSRLEGFGSIYGCSAIIPCADSPVGHPIVTMTWCQTTLCSVLAASEADGACGGDSSARQLEAGAQSSGSVPVAAADAGIQVKHRLLLMFRSTRARQAMRVQRPVFYIARLLWLCLRLCRAGARSLTVPAPSSRAADRRPFNGHTVIVPSPVAVCRRQSAGALRTADRVAARLSPGRRFTPHVIPAGGVVAPQRAASVDQRPARC